VGFVYDRPGENRQVSVSIRDTGPEEHSELLELVLAAYSALGDFLEDDYNFEADVVQLMDDPNTQVIVAELDGQPAGTITFYPDGRSYDEGVPADWSCLRTLAVLPSIQGRGVGRALMNECLDRARALGRTRMLLHTHHFMKAAIRLHESLGFTRAPELDYHYSPELTFIAYVLDL
jgi:GNAT superfamily N-acetyltransferase